jgi:hypothetical protein
MTDTTVFYTKTATTTPCTDTKRIECSISICDKQVPKAAESIIGKCVYYYRPLHKEYIEKSGVATWEAMKAWVTFWNPFDDIEVAKRLVKNHDALIQASSTDPDWSRHASFMMRHIGCGHNPPGYYVNYGYYYCSIYGAKLAPRLSAQGKNWLEKARVLLQQNMEKGLEQNMQSDSIRIPCKRNPPSSVSMTVNQFQLELNNDTFKQFAFNTHVPAYLDAGLADLPISDLMMIAEQPNINEWTDSATWSQAASSGTAVTKDWVTAALNRLKSWLN